MARALRRAPLRGSWLWGGARTSLGEAPSQNPGPLDSRNPSAPTHRPGHPRAGGGFSAAASYPRAAQAMAVVGWLWRAGPRSPLARLRPQIRPGAHLPLPQTDLGVDRPASASSGAGRPLELADLGGIHAAAPGTSVRSGSEAPLGEALCPRSPYAVASP